MVLMPYAHVERHLLFLEFAGSFGAIHREVDVVGPPARCRSHEAVGAAVGHPWRGKDVSATGRLSQFGLVLPVRDARRQSVIHRHQVAGLLAHGEFEQHIVAVAHVEVSVYISENTECAGVLIIESKVVVVPEVGASAQVEHQFPPVLRGHVVEEILRAVPLAGPAVPRQRDDFVASLAAVVGVGALASVDVDILLSAPLAWDVEVLVGLIDVSGDAAMQLLVPSLEYACPCVAGLAERESLAADAAGGDGSVDELQLAAQRHIDIERGCLANVVELHVDGSVGGGRVAECTQTAAAAAEVSIRLAVLVVEEVTVPYAHSVFSELVCLHHPCVVAWHIAIVDEVCAEGSLSVVGLMEDSYDFVSQWVHHFVIIVAARGQRRHCAANDKDGGKKPL